ncbi:MAG TPA: preprotein translocase subunit SecY [Candidatus Paceibacterota bacterium]|nr:preprotein translocase subunit SecY [Candidatus Paceibacterota bacterium]
MESIFRKIKLLFQDSSLLGKISFTVFILVVFRALAAIPIPGVDQGQLEALFQGSSAFGQFLGFINVFSGGGLSQLSIVMLGVGPYITASIVLQLLTVMSPKLKAMYQGEDGEGSRRRFIQYGRILTVPLALIQGYSFIALLERQGVIVGLDTADKLINVLVITAGTVLLMWLGELISEFGIGNGVSLLIFAGIVSALPTQLTQAFLSFDRSMAPMYIAFAAVAVLIILAVVYITEAERPIPVTYAKQVRGNKVFGGVSTYLPIRLTQTGVMPIIFALSFLLFPQVIANMLTLTSNATLTAYAMRLTEYLANPVIYGTAYFILVFVFTYIYTAIIFDPKQISENLQKGGAFLPGVRPGQPTAEHLGVVITRLTLVGALFLGIIAVMPIAMQGIFKISSLALGGTALLIVVSVIMDVVKKVNAQLTAREY